MRRSKILIIEDDAELSEIFTSLLEPKYDVQKAIDGLAGLKAALRTPPDLILLDLKMPRMDGFQTCQLLRADKEFDDIPIFIVSGYGGQDDRNRALEAGANDFMEKPVDVRELLARIDRQLSAVDGASSNLTRFGVLRCGDLRLDLNKWKAHIADEEVHFSQLEFRLLYLLATNFEKTVSRQAIIEDVWDHQEVSSRIIDPHIVSIRNKLSPSKLSILSIYGKGYSLRLGQNNT